MTVAPPASQSSGEDAAETCLPQDSCLKCPRASPGSPPLPQWGFVVGVVVSLLEWEPWEGVAVRGVPMPAPHPLDPGRLLCLETLGLLTCVTLRRKSPVFVSGHVAPGTAWLTCGTRSLLRCLLSVKRGAPWRGRPEQHLGAPTGSAAPAPARARRTRARTARASGPTPARRSSSLEPISDRRVAPLLFKGNVMGNDPL